VPIEKPTEHDVVEIEVARQRVQRSAAKVS